MLSLRSSPKSLPCPTPLLRPLILTSPPQLPPTSPPLSSRPTTLPSPSSRESQLMEPSRSLDPSVPTRLSISQLSTKPVPTPSRLFPRLLPPQSTLLLRFQLPPMLLLQLPLLLPQLLMLLTPLPQLPMLLTPPPQLLMLLMPLPLLLPDTLDMLDILEPLLLHQPSLLKHIPKFSSVPKSETERGLYRLCAVSEFLRHTYLYNRRVGVSWWLFLVFLRIAINVSNALQYDVTTSITSGLFSLLNVLYFRYRRELFINKSVLFL